MNRKTIVKKLLGWLLISMFFGFLLCIVYIETIKNVSDFNRGHERRMNCFGGLEYGIIIFVQLFFAIFSSTVFLNVYRKVRHSKLWRPIVFFAPVFLLAVTMLSSNDFQGEDDVDMIIYMTTSFLIPWVWFYFRFSELFNKKALSF